MSFIDFQGQIQLQILLKLQTKRKNIIIKYNMNAQIFANPLVLITPD